MLTRHSAFGRIFTGRFPGIGAVAFCALTAGWIAGQHALFLPASREDVLSPSLSPALPRLAPEHESKAPGFSRERESHASGVSPGKRVSRATLPSGLLSPDLLSRHERDLTGFAQAITFYKSGDLAQGDAAAAAANDKIVKTALEWIALRSFPRETGFDRLQAFMQAHPAWPALDWLKKRSEESLFGDRKSAALIKTYFSGADPETPAGKLALARALTDDGKTSEAAALVRDVWREADLNAQLEAKVRSDFGSYLDQADHKFRADRLLYKGETAAAFRAAALAGRDELALAKARAAVIEEAPSDKLLAKVPPALRRDPSYLFAQIHKLRHANKIREAVDIMLAAPRDPALLIDGDAWWIERRLLARKLLDQNDAATAYKLCAEHSASSHEMKLQAEFHAGWIALRFLNDPVRAAVHFDTLAKLAVTPMSRARAEYWQGRAAEASSASDAAGTALAFYEQAANYAATYYGQLARGKLGLTELPIRTIPNEAKGDEREDSI
ncbi:MAG TPA: lytic transglycosylase domain-containing protein, partial [Methylocella sp.]|nr:lytic transglycosylase domain-containing protein [Methylocella sp.]